LWYLYWMMLHSGTHFVRHIHSSYIPLSNCYHHLLTYTYTVQSSPTTITRLHITYSGTLYRLQQGVFSYLQNAIQFYSINIYIISFTSIRKVWPSLLWFHETHECWTALQTYALYWISHKSDNNLGKNYRQQFNNARMLSTAISAPISTLNI